jgi:Icc protein
MRPEGTTVGDGERHLLHLTDPHLFADPAAEVYSVNTADSLRRVVQQALAEAPRAPAAILVTGDIGDDCSEAAYRRFRALLQPAGAPVFCLAGNHDAPATMARLLNDAGFQYGGQARLGGWALVLVDSHVPDAPFGRVGDTRLEALERDLHALRDQSVLVAVHHPPMPVGSAWVDAIGLRDGPALLALLGHFPNVRAVLSGHVHQGFEGRQGALRLLTSPSTCAQFTPSRQDFEVDVRPPGYRWLRLWPDGHLETEVRWLEREAQADRPTPDGAR